MLLIRLGAPPRAQGSSRQAARWEGHVHCKLACSQAWHGPAASDSATGDHHYETAHAPSNRNMWVSTSSVHGEYAADQRHSRQWVEIPSQMQVSSMQLSLKDPPGLAESALCCPAPCFNTLLTCQAAHHKSCCAKSGKHAVLPLPPHLLAGPAGLELTFTTAETLSASKLSHCYEIGQRRPHHSTASNQGPCLTAHASACCCGCWVQYTWP